MNPSPAKTRASSSSDEDGAMKEARRKTKLEAGCGYGRRKAEVLEAFWTVVWPALEKEGWTKAEGTGKQAGSIFFIPKGIDVNSGRKGVDYYDRIKAVINRVMERRNESEAAAADAYNAATGGTAEPRVSRARRTHTNPGPVTKRVDLSWKDRGSFYPKHPSRVGTEFQATDLPCAGSFVTGSGPGYDQIWDPEKARSKHVLDFVHHSVPYDKKEAAIMALHDRDYEVLGLSDAVSKVEPVDGSDWTQEEKDIFHSEIFRLRKDFSAVSKSINKSMNSCLAYYLGTYKKSDDYRLLKTVYVDERHQRRVASAYLDACAVCGDGGSLLICDGCEAEYHMTCVRPALLTVPEGSWECDECLDRKFLEARDDIIRKTRLYEEADTPTRKRKASEGDSPSTDDTNVEPVFRPTSPVRKEVRELAACIKKALSDHLP